MNVTIRTTLTANNCSDCMRPIAAGERIVYIGESLIALCLRCADEARIQLGNEFASLRRRT